MKLRIHEYETHGNLINLEETAPDSRETPERRRKLTEGKELRLKKGRKLEVQPREFFESSNYSS